MFEIISGILNVVLAGSFISTKSGNIDQYHADLDEFKNKIKGIEIDALSYWSSGSNSETDRLSIQIKTEIHHLIREAQCLAKRYKNFKYEDISGRLLTFKQTITGGDFETVTRQADFAKVDNINAVSVDLCSQVDSFYVTNKFLTSLTFWNRI